jgi:hypothetical protein
MLGGCCRLWHQLTLKLEEVIASEYWTTNDQQQELHDLYTHFIMAFANRISHLKLALMAVSLAKSYTGLLHHHHHHYHHFQ